MNETELLATLQVVFVLLCGVLVFSLVCTIVEVIRVYRHTRVVRHTAKHSRGHEVPVGRMAVPKSAAEVKGYTAEGEGTAQVTVSVEGTLNATQVAELTSDEPKQTPGYSRAPRKRHARHGR